jgi:uncharacterized membrane protein YhaH (DUF805 family)
MISTLAQTYTSYTTTTTSTSPMSGALLAAIVIGSLLVAVIAIAAMWKMFEKAGKPGWAAIIPVYNSWVLFEISDKPGWWALISLIPYVGAVVFLVLHIIAMLQLAKNFGKSTTFAVVGLILFSFIGMLMLGFGDATYKSGKSAAAKTAA